MEPKKNSVKKNSVKKNSVQSERRSLGARPAEDGDWTPRLGQSSFLE